MFSHDQVHNLTSRGFMRHDDQLSDGQLIERVEIIGDFFDQALEHLLQREMVRDNNDNGGDNGIDEVVTGVVCGAGQWWRRLLNQLQETL